MRTDFGLELVRDGFRDTSVTDICAFSADQVIENKRVNTSVTDVTHFSRNGAYRSRVNIYFF